MYLAHAGVDHSTGATHGSVRDNVLAASAFAGVTLTAAVLLAGTLTLVKRNAHSSTKRKVRK